MDFYCIICALNAIYISSFEDFAMPVWFDCGTINITHLNLIARKTVNNNDDDDGEVDQLFALPPTTSITNSTAGILRVLLDKLVFIKTFVVEMHFLSILGLKTLQSLADKYLTEYCLIIGNTQLRHSLYDIGSLVLI